MATDTNRQIYVPTALILYPGTIVAMHMCNNDGINENHSSATPEPTLQPTHG
jgi:hypothetical protein